MLVTCITDTEGPSTQFSINISSSISEVSCILPGSKYNSVLIGMNHHLVFVFTS
jgi:hypothetical protein